MKNEFYLTKKLPSYIFAKISQLKSEAVKNGIEILDFGMGNPDSAPPSHVMKSLLDIAKNPKLFGYSVTGGVDVLKKSLCDYYKRRFDVELDYTSEAIVTIGAKEGIASLVLAISDDENYVCLPSPSYPIHTFAFTLFKSKVHHIGAIKAWDFLEKFKKHVESAKQKPQAVLVSYPCNPTTEIADLGFYEEIVSFCKKHQIYIISDVAYAELYFDEKDKPHSILEIKGAKDIAIEFSSISKSYSMAGCRVGFAVGNKALISALYKVKCYLDYSSFEPLQLAAAEALTEKSNEYLTSLRLLYEERANFLVNLFSQELNWKIDRPRVGMFCWAMLPEKFSALSSFEFCKEVIAKTGVVMIPGSAFGHEGEGYVRISLIHDQENMKRATAKLKHFFNKC